MGVFSVSPWMDIMPLLLLVLFVLSGLVPAVAADRDEALAAGSAAWWVHFTDKGLSPDDEAAAAERAAEDLTARARARRAKARRGPLTDVLDVPLHEPYVEAVVATGAELRTRFKWLNAISVDATPGQLRLIARLGCVTAVRRVAAGRREPVPFERVEVDRSGRGPGERSLDYGDCASQIVPIQVDQLHDAGFTGAGMLIGVFDTGFELGHETLAAVDVQAAWDFVNDDAVVENEAGDHPNQHNHGTLVLSILAGFAPGNLIGPAYGATFLLGKTESLDFEMPIEEDFWVEAAVWAESLGVDVITSSLGYKDWYTWDDLDGDTATITIAADLAVANGVTVLTSAGNQGTQDWTYVLTPADGDSVIAVGAVDSLDVLADFSSRGPTADGRIKPDVCAMGNGTLFAIPGTLSDYGRGTGTSLSAPLVAGAAALLLEAHPLWGPIDVREALRTTATQASSPDTALGWGVIRAADATLWSTDAVVTASAPGPGLLVTPNPSASASVIRYSLPSRTGAAELAIFDLRGRLVQRLPADRAGTGSVVWDGRDASGRLVPTGIYFARLTAAGTESTARILRLR
jgi:subtilisin family serine protease